MSVELTVDVHAQHAEGPCCNATDQRLWWVDITLAMPDGSCLLSGTSWYDVAPEHRDRQPLAGSIFVDRPGVSGPAAAHFAID